MATVLVSHCGFFTEPADARLLPCIIGFGAGGVSSIQCDAVGEHLSTRSTEKPRFQYLWSLCSFRLFYRYTLLWAGRSIFSLEMVFLDWANFDLDHNRRNVLHCAVRDQRTKRRKCANGLARCYSYSNGFNPGRLLHYGQLACPLWVEDTLHLYATSCWKFDTCSRLVHRRLGCGDATLAFRSLPGATDEGSCCCTVLLVWNVRYFFTLCNVLVN